MEEKKYPGYYYQPLFDLLNQEHGITPLESEMADIIVVVEKMRDTNLKHPAGAVWVKASEFKYKETCHRPYRFQEAPGEEYDYGEIYITEDEGSIFLDVDHECEYIPQNDGRWLKYDILDESETTNNVLPTFWDVAKAFKWAAEYRDEIGGHLTLYNDQWTLISEDEDGNENETQDLTPGNVAELYCLQNGFTKEKEATPAAAREEDAVGFAEWLAKEKFESVNGKTMRSSNWNAGMPSELYELFKQQKENP